MVHMRQFTLDDYGSVRTLWEDAGPGLGLGRSDAIEEIAKKQERDPDLFLVAEDEGQIVGTVIGGFDGRRGIIYHLAVVQSHQSHGLGKQLMEELERRLVAKGCLRCYLLVKPEGKEVIRFYKRMGWDEMPLTIMGKNIA